MQPKISIVVPIYKVKENLLRACVESCLVQTEKNIEIILVDDCSKDASADICDEYALKDERIRVIHKELNGGLSAARNTGVLASKGEWITFVDGDDWIENDTCEIVSRVSDDEVQMIFFGMKRDYENGQEIFKMSYADQEIFENEKCKQLQIDVLDYSKRVSTAYGKFIRRQFIFDNNIFHDEEVRCGIEGIEFNLRVFGFLKKAVFFDEYKYHYVYNLQSITGAPSETTNQFILLGLKKMKEYISQIENNDALQAKFTARVQRVITDTSIGCYFNPNYKLKYKVRKEKLNCFLSDPIISEVLTKTKSVEHSKMKRMMYFSSKHRLYLMLKLFGWMRIKYLAQI